MTHYAKQGFTLIELLVVIAIIAVLAAILFPVFAKAREKSWQATCTSNQRQIAAAVAIYVQDNDESFFPADATVWATKLPGLPAEVFHCPSTSDPGSASTPNYGFNASLYGVTLGNMLTPATTPLTADYNALNARASYQIADWNIDIDTRHNNKDAVILSCVDGHVAAEVINNPNTPGSLLGPLLAKGYTPFDGSPVVMSQPAQINSYAPATYGIQPGHWNGSQYVTDAAPTVYTIPDSACYSSSSTPPNVMITADLATSQAWNYMEVALGAYLATPVTTASYTAGCYLTMCGGFSTNQNATWGPTASLAYSFNPSATSTDTSQLYSSNVFFRMTTYIINSKATTVCSRVKNNGPPGIIGWYVTNFNWNLVKNQNQLALFSFSNGSQNAYAQNISFALLPIVPTQ